VLLAFKFSVDKCVIDDLTIELSRHVYSEEYIALTKEFYLNM
jgi:tRNA1Val (adenine37-N6)-methyltransferase